MTSAALEDLAGGSSLYQLQLDSLFLLTCSVSRGEPGVDVDEPGQVEAEVRFESSQAERTVGYEVSSTYSFFTKRAQLIARIEATFAANYSKPSDLGYTEEELQAFAHSVALQVAPFQREFLASMTNRLAMTPFYLPLVRQPDVRF